MSAKPPVKVVLCWHMHQPVYRDPISGIYRLPWTYLHAIKDYVDMVAHLEEVPEARAVVNFTPTLLEQIDDYAARIRSHLASNEPIPDPLLNALSAPDMPREPALRIELVRACLRANEHNLINRYPQYRRLADLAQWLDVHAEHVGHVADQYLVDLLVWYHLAWLGETVRWENEWVRSLMARGSDFTMEERRRLLTLVGDLIGSVVDRYKALAESGTLELSVTPYGHPIVPLLLDIRTARQAVPHLQLPKIKEYPGGRDRARWHIREAITVFERHFGFAPSGCWPAEGGVCSDTLSLLEEAGFRWAATGQQVLRHSVDKYGAGRHDAVSVHRPYHLPGQKLACFSRDDGLSDLVGFAYSRWHADDAVANLVHHLENIAVARHDQADTVVSIVLDGENAWEYYPKNGYYFLRALYRTLAEHPQIELTTFSDCLDADVRSAALSGMVSGSWVYGTFTTWIGQPDKNRGWDMLSEAKQAYDKVIAEGDLDESQREQAERQLAVCEGSDWFWWFGDENPVASVRDFDFLFREHLTSLYHLLGQQAPEYLGRAFTHGGGAPEHGGVMRPGAAAGTVVEG